jgi:diguanylate cyclase (GGDEF)-like protein
MRRSSMSSVRAFALRLAAIVFLTAVTVAAAETILAIQLIDRAVVQESISRVDAAAASVSTATADAQDVPGTIVNRVTPLTAEPDVTDVVAILADGETVVLPELGTAVTTDPQALDEEVRGTVDAVLDDGRTRYIDTGDHKRTVVAPITVADRRGALAVTLDTQDSAVRAQQLWLLFGLALLLGALAMAPLVFLGGARRLIRRYGQALATGNTDDLTGLGTRRAFRRDLSAHVARAQQEGTSLTLALLDVNGLELVNSTVGRRRRDALLAALGKALGAAMHQIPGRRTYRIGGDAFAIIMPGTSQHDVFAITDDLRSTIARTVAPLTANVGLASFDDECCADMESLLITADAALFEARSLGGNRVVGANGSDDEPRWMATSGMDGPYS